MTKTSSIINLFLKFSDFFINEKILHQVISRNNVRISPGIASMKKISVFTYVYSQY